MGHQHERTGEFQQAIFQHFEGWNIQVVGRLIENEQVCGLEHESGDEEPCLFTAGQFRHGEIQLFGTEEKAFRP
jgi:hypothetical protein